MAVKPIPDGFHTVTPYLLVKGVPQLIEFLEKAFDAKVIHKSTTPEGSINHAQVQIGDSMVMMGEATDQWKPMPGMLYLYVENVDTLYQRGLQAGGTSVQEVADAPYGDRVGGVQDPTGNQWWIATHIKDVTPA